jgi:hypothetical protein
MRVRRAAINFIMRALGPLNRSLHQKRVVMIHHGRCGSSVVGLMLRDSGLVAWGGELLREDKIPTYEKRWKNFDYRKVIKYDEGHSPRRCYGFEMKYQQMESLGITKAGFIHDMEEFGYKYFIVLGRKNYLRKRTSRLVADATGRHHILKDRKADLVQVQIDPGTLLPWFKQNDEDIAEMENVLRDKPTLFLTYEDDIESDPVKAYLKVCNFLDIPVRSINPRLGRTTPFRLRDIIMNYDEVQQLLKPTQYAWMLEAE